MTTQLTDPDGAMETVEEVYEFMLAYAAQGRRTEEDKSSAGIRAYLQRAEQALGVLLDDLGVEERHGR